MFVAMVTRADAARLGDDLGLALVVLGVEHLMLDAAALEHAGKLFALLDRDRTDQHRSAVLLHVRDFRRAGCVSRCFVPLASNRDFLIVLGDNRADLLGVDP